MRKPEYLLFIAAVILIAVGFIAVLPPFEGFDETAHYSSIQQIADTGVIPRYGRSFLSRTVVDYRLHGPSPYGSLHPPFDQNGGMTYRDFFAWPDRLSAFMTLYRRPGAPGVFQPSTQANWQSQHPPLYYLLMTPLLKATSGLSLVSQLFVLRLVSFLLALAGLLIAWRATLAHAGPQAGRCLSLGFLLYPLVVPMFFPEFARLGNDSLCLFLFALIWALLLGLADHADDRRGAFGMGIVLGLGLLTKAFFLAISAGIALFFLWRIWQLRDDRTLASSVLKQLVLIIVPALLIGAVWYVTNWITYGSWVGGDEFITLGGRGGLAANLGEKLTLTAFARGITATLVSWSWAGTWSLARINELMRIPLIVLTGWLFVRYAYKVRRQPLADRVWLPVWILAPFFAALVYHVFVGIALTGSGGTAGWYLHVLAPVFALIFALGAEGLTEWPRRLLAGLAAYAVFFLAAVQWMQMLMYAGLAVKGDNKYYQFQTADLLRVSDVLDRLNVLGWPCAGMICFIAGLLCLAASLVKALRSSA